MKRLVRLLLWSLTLTLLLAVAVIGFAVSTQTGLDALLALAERIAPGRLSYERIEGRLLSPLRVEGLRYQDGELDFQLRRAELHWRPADLLAGRLQIDQLHADGIALHLPKSPPEPEETTEPLALGDIRLPLAVTLGDLLITDIAITPPGAQQPIVINRAALAAQTSDQALVVDRLEIAAPEGSLHLDGRLTPMADYPLAINLDWRFQHPEYGPVNGHGTVTGALRNTLTLNQNVSGWVTAQLQGEVRQVLEQPAWSAKLNLEVPNLGTFSPGLADSKLSGLLTSEGTLNDFQAGGRLAATLPEIGPVGADFAASGSTQAIHVRELALRSERSPLSLTAQADLDLAAQTVAANGRWQALAWPLTGQPQVISPSGEFTLQGKLQDYRLEAKANLASPDLGDLRAVVKAAGSDQAVQFSELSVRSPDERRVLRATGEFQFAELAFKADGEWRNLAWPLIGQPQVESPQGALKASGSVKDYSFALDTRVKGPELPDSTWKLTGKGSDQALQELTVTGQLLEGELQARLQAAWRPAVTWQAEVTGTGLNPGAQWPDAKGKLALKLKTEGRLTDSGPEGTVQIEDLSGIFRDQRVQGNGQLAVKGQDLTIQALRLEAGKAALTAAGSLGQRWDLNWKLDVPQLGSLVPNARGAISGAGSVQGRRDQPQARLNLQINNLAYGETAIQALTGEASVDISGQSRSQLTLNGKDLRVAGQTWRTLTVEGAGVPGEHGLKAGLEGPLGRFTLALNGGLKDKTWRGQLTTLSATDTPAGDWRLDRPMPLQASPQAVRADRACLSSRPTQICLQGQWDASKGGEGRITLEQLNPERFAALLPRNVRIDTAISGEATGGILPDGALKGKTNLTIRPGRIQLTAKGYPVAITLNGGYLRAAYDSKDLAAQARLDLAQTGQFNADVNIRDLAGQPRVNGAVTGEFRELALISLFVPELQNVQGQLTVNMRLSGGLPIPAMEGAVRLQNGAVEIPQVNARIEAIQAAVAGTGRGPLQISASARSGPGDLRLAGQLDPATRQLQLTIRGDNFQVANAPTLQALISPDLQVAMSVEKMEVTGQVTIPSAFIGPPSGGPGAVTPSRDVVIVGKNGQAEAPPQGANLFARVRVILGDDVRVSAYDLNAKLKGDLLVEQSPQLAPRGTGTITVETGDYLVYGQKLDIKQGRVLFSGGPLDNPVLDLAVERQVGQVIAGARVKGTLKEPELVLYSEPAMSDADIISYIVFGQPASTGAKGASLTIGRYLTPDLYISYGIGLFSRLNTFNMRYRLTDWLSLESETSGSASGADVVYKVER